MQSCSPQVSAERLRVLEQLLCACLLAWAECLLACSPPQVSAEGLRVLEQLLLVVRPSEGEPTPLAKLPLAKLFKALHVGGGQGGCLGVK